MSTDSNSQTENVIKQPPAQPSKCLSPDCQFYGNPTTENYCSACYKKVISLRTQTGPSSEAPKSSSDSQSDSSLPQQKNKNRCYLCNKKVGMLGFKCKCNYIFCGTHRYADQHNCTFDYKKQNHDLLEKANPVIQSAKVESI